MKTTVITRDVQGNRVYTPADARRVLVKEGHEWQVEVPLVGVFQADTLEEATDAAGRSLGGLQ